MERLDYLRVLVLAENTVPFPTALLGQHGLSFLIEGKKEKERERAKVELRVIMDVGQIHDALMTNMELLKVNICAVDAIVLSHCHYDHTSGVAALLAATKRRDIPLIAHPAIFRSHFLAKPALRSLGIRPEDRAEAIVAAGGALLLTSDPVQLMPGLMTTGEVPRVTPDTEEGLSVITVTEGRTAVDHLLDDIALIACVKGKGLVVIAGCSHSGIINIVKRALALFPGEKLYAVIGGFHLIEASQQRLAAVVEELAGFAPALVAAGHCTGFKAQAALYHTLGDRFVPLHVGAEFIFSEM